MHRYKRRLFVLISIPISLIILILVKGNSWVAEYILARGIYKFLSQILSNITAIIPFSIMEISIYLTITLGVFFIIHFIKLLVKDKENRKENIIKYSLNLSCILSIFLFLFVIFAGTNYYRYSFSKIHNMSVEESSIDELYELNMYLARKAYEYRHELEFIGKDINDEGVIEFTDTSWKELTKKASQAFDNLSFVYPVFKGTYGRPKPVIASKFMSRMEITGIFWPFTLEANVNVHAPDYTIPSTMAHEIAHQRGFMREDEANYIAFLACIYSDDLIFKYSGTMLALTSAGNALYREDPVLYAKTREIFNEGMIADLRDKSSYWSQFNDTVISTVSNKMNDTYLKANNQKDGVKSYGRMVDLLLGGYKGELYY